MGARSTRFFGPSKPAAGGADLAEAPAGHVLLVKHVVTYNDSATTRVLFLYIGAVGAAQTVLRHTSVTGADAVQHEVWWVLEPGQFLRYAANGGDQVVAVFGAQLVA